jgi:hypothetical protein
VNTTLPTRLADRAYLVAYDVERKRLRGGNLGKVLNAAVLIELWLAGSITDENKCAAITSAAGRPAHRYGDVEAGVLARLRASKPRRWKHWVRQDARTTERTVRARLAEVHLVTVEERRILGLFDRPRVTVGDTRAIRELVARCRAAALQGRPVAQVEALDAALVAIVAAAEWNTVFSGRERRQHRARIAELATRSGPAAKALRDVVKDDQATMHGGAGVVG